MESALHDKNPAVFRHTNDFLHRLTRQVFVAVGPDIVLVMRVHGQGRVKQHPGAEMRGFIGLNIMKHGIHVYDIHLRSILDHADKREKPAVPRFNRRRLEREGLPLRRIHQHDDCVFEPSVGRNRKLLKNTPAGSGGNPTAIDRIGKRDQVEPFGNRRPLRDCHFADDCASVRDLNFLIRPGDRKAQHQPSAQNEYQHPHESSTISSCEHTGNSAMVSKDCAKEKGGSRWPPPSPDQPHPAHSRTLDLTSLRPG
jgi:hypothetical protein